MHSLIQKEQEWFRLLWFLAPAACHAGGHVECAKGQDLVKGCFMSDRVGQLMTLIHDKQTDRAIEMVRMAKDHEEGEAFVFTVLREEDPSQELVAAVFVAFLGTRQNRRPKHGVWVHSLSHFMKVLWGLRMHSWTDYWIKRFNEVAFRGANELHDPDCSDRLVSDFCSFAKFDDDPADFHLTPENLRWMDLENDAYTRARIEAGRFESEEAFLRWKLRRPEMYTAFDYDAQTNLIDIERIRSIIQQLQELGADTSEFNGFERDLLTKQFWPKHENPHRHPGSGVHGAVLDGFGREPTASETFNIGIH